MTGIPGQLSTALASALASGRPHFNARVAEVRHRFPSFDTAAFAEFVKSGLESVVRSVATVAPDRIGFAVFPAYDVALELVAQGLAGPGARSSLVDRVWMQLVPRLGRLLAADSGEVLGLLSNAAVNVSSEPAARPDEWLEVLTAVADCVDSIESLRSVGVIAAWRAGMVQFRESALLAADRLPEQVALRAVAAAEHSSWAQVRQSYSLDPWWSPQPSVREAVRTGREVGRFTGFGGSFSQPPSLHACEQGFLVRSGDRFSFLLSDAYGSVLLPATSQEYANADQGTRSLGATICGSDVVIGNRRIASELPEDGLVLNGNDHTLALTSPYTYAIRLLPCLGPG
ncbi:MAG: hypothetical protein AB7I68_13965 [Porticoccaceae bacterium]